MSRNSGFTGRSIGGENEPLLRRRGRRKVEEEEDERQNLVKSLKGDDNHWRVRWYDLLNGHSFMIFLVTLLGIDLVCILVSLTLESMYPPCDVVAANCLCSAGEKSCKPVPAAVEDGLVALSFISLIVLMIFILELMAHILVLGFVTFFSKPFFILDFLVVTISFALEIFLLTKEMGGHDDSSSSSDITTVLTSLVLMRAWRFLRIGHGAYLEAREEFENEIKDLKELLHQKNDHIQGLENQLIARGPPINGALGVRSNEVLNLG